jgi:RraA family protein
MDAALIAALHALDCAALADADKALRVVDAAIRPVRTGRRLVGPARTVRCFEDFLTVIKALDESAPGEVLVIDTQGSRRAVLGELFSLEATRRGLAGIVVDGYVRDVRTIATLPIAVYARGSCPAAGTSARLTATQVPVCVGGVAVEPGDIIVGDDDGLVVGSVEELRALVPAAREIEAREQRLREHMAAGRGLVTMLNLADHFAAIERGEASRLRFTFDD